MAIAVDTNLFARGSALIEAAAAAREAEAAGYAGIWVSESGSRDPFLRLAIAATQTRRARLGTAIAIAFVRSPMVLAQMAWDLAEASDGRFILGLGSQVKGHNERRFSVPWTAPGPRMRDLIPCLRAIFDSWQHDAPANFRSDHYQYTLKTPASQREPLRRPFVDWAGRVTGVPIYLAGVNPYMCRLAGELCDGFWVHPLHSRAYLAEMVRPTVQTGAERAGRSLDSIELCVQPFVVTGRTDEEMRRWADVVKRQIAYYASTRTYARVLDLHGWGDVPGTLHEMTVQNRWDEIGTVITDEMLEEFAVVGRPEEIPAKLQARYEGLVNRIALYHRDVPVDHRALLAALSGSGGRMPVG
jgi:probable F420-dependent oxidoreductase